MAENGRKLSTKQKRAIAALLAERNVRAAAESARVGERTLYRWLSDAEFRAALAAAEGDAIDQATRRLIAMTGKAADELQAILTDLDSTPAVRLRAIELIFANALKLRELRNVEERLAALEKAVNNDKSNQ